jgi:hypothetical protein
MEREPLVLELNQLAIDEDLRRRTNTLIGHVLLLNSVTVESVNEQPPEHIHSLASAIERAKVGEQEALELVRTNVATDYFERAYKYGFVSEVPLTRDEQGNIMQHGQSLHDVHVNSLRYITDEKLRNRAKIEALNSLRDQHLSESGMLQDYARVTFSLVHDELTEEEAEEVGFFVGTRSVSIQLLTEDMDGELVMQTAFVAGREHAKSESFDKESIASFAETMGVSYAGASSETILARPLLIHKSLLPDGVLSVVEQYDQAASELTGRQKFFGRDNEKQADTEDYLIKMQENAAQTKRMESEINTVVAQLLQLNKPSPLQATDKLAQLNDAMLKARIITDETIDASVLGSQAAYYVEHARHYTRLGQFDHPDVARLQQSINRVGASSSCPSSGGKSSMSEGSMLGLESVEDSEDTTPEDCDFISKECPKCGEKNVKTSCRNGVYYGACGCKSE